MKTVDEWAGMTETDQWYEYVSVAMATNDSPDPVVVRLEAEVERLTKQEETDNAFWRETVAIKDLTISRLNDLLADRGISITAMSRKLTECKESEEAARTENTRLRGLLREACGGWNCDSDWAMRVNAALEGKP